MKNLLINDDLKVQEWLLNFLSLEENILTNYRCNKRYIEKQKLVKKNIRIEI